MLYTTSRLDTGHNESVLQQFQEGSSFALRAFKRYQDGLLFNPSRQGKFSIEQQFDIARNDSDEIGYVTNKLWLEIAPISATLSILSRWFWGWTFDKVSKIEALTQNNLGNALSTLGERESGTARLEEAVNAYRDALQEMTRERVPLQWVTTQNNLGNALRTLGERESGTARLEEAVAAWDTCLIVTASVWPTEWVEDVRSKRDEAQAEIARRQTK